MDNAEEMPMAAENLKEKGILGVIQELDYEISSGLQQLRTKFGNYFWKFLTQAGYPYPWILIGFIFGVILDFYHVGYVLTFAGLSSLLTVIPLKLYSKRRRPYDKHLDLKPLKRERENDWSFPSGHTYYATVSGLSLAFCYGGFYSIILMGGLGILVAVSRMYLGVHFLTDVVFAYFLGVLVAYLIYLSFPHIMVLHYLT